MAINNKSVTTYQDVTCPYCSLHCDDLVIQNQNELLKVKKNGCHKAIEQIEHPQIHLEPKINGRNVSIDDAITQTSKILRQAKQPLIAGLGTDVSGMRYVMQLADETGAIIDHMHSDGLMRNIKVTQDDGWLMTTLAEIKNRADLVIFAGTNGIENYPRFFERVIWNQNALFNKNIKQRDIVYIGHQLDTKAGKSPSGHQPNLINCKQEQIGEIITTLHALVVGNKLQQTDVAGINITILENLAERMKKAKYGVIVWAPGELTYPYAELTIQAICAVIKFINRTTRFAGFTLGGNDGGISAMNVSAWQSGYPLRINFSNGYPEYDPYKYATRNVLKRKEVDALFWISSFNSHIAPPRARIPTAVLASPGTKLGFKADVFIPVGTPGIDHKGQLFRTDNVVALPLKQIRNNNYLSVAEIIKRVLELL